MDMELKASDAVQLGTHPNGEKFARLTLQARGISATVEGKGATTDEAVDNVHSKMRELEVMAGDAADAMQP